MGDFHLTTNRCARSFTKVEMQKPPTAMIVCCRSFARIFSFGKANWTTFVVRLKD